MVWYLVVSRSSDWSWACLYSATNLFLASEWFRINGQIQYFFGVEKSNEFKVKRSSLMEKLGHTLYLIPPSHYYILINCWKSCFYLWIGPIIAFVVLTQIFVVPWQDIHFVQHTVQANTLLTNQTTVVLVHCNVEFHNTSLPKQTRVLWN